MGLGLALPWMLWWLVAAIIPLVIARLALRQPRLVRWGPTDLVAAAARSSRLTRGGLPWLLVIVRGLVLASAALAAARPLWQPPATPVGRQVAAGGPESRIVILTATPAFSGFDRHDAAMVDASLAIRHAVESLAPSELALGRSATALRGSAAPTITQLAVADLPLLPAAPHTLLILVDQPPLAETEARLLTAAVASGAGLLICLGPRAIGDDEARRSTSAWLEDLAGIAVAGRLTLSDSAIEVVDALGERSARVPDDGAAPPGGMTVGGFTPLAGPAAIAAAELFAGHTTTVLARAAPEGHPLLLESSHGRGTVCVSALPMTLPAPGPRDAADAWSDLAAWPAFIPFIDRLASRLLAASSASPNRSADDGAWHGRASSVPRSPAIPLAPFVLAAAIACLLADAWLSSGEPHGRGMLPRGGRAAMLAILATMGVVWSRLPAAPQPRTDRQRPVALLIDTSPSMTGRESASDGAAGTRLDAVLAALTSSAGNQGPLDRIARDWPLSIFTAASDLARLGGSPAGISAATIGSTTASSGVAASRIGDAVVTLLSGTDDRIGGATPLPAAIIIASDGAITAGHSWRSTARRAADRGVPLVAISAAGDGHAQADTLPPGFRVTAVRGVRLCHAAEPFAIDVEAEATAEGPPLELLIAAAAGGPTLARAPLACSPASDGMSVRFVGRLSAPPGSFATGSRFVSPLISVGRPGAPPPQRPRAGAMTCPLAVTDAPVRVLMIDSSPRFEYRFLERLLARDSGFELETCLLEPQATGRGPTAPLPRSTAAWNRFDVVIVGDVSAGPDAAGRAEAWRSLREAAAADGIGIAWLPGERAWSDPDAGLAWLPALPGDVAAPTVPRRLRTTTGGRAGDWLPWTSPESTAAPPATMRFDPEIFSVLRPASLAPTARIIATAAAADGAAEPAAATAVFVDQFGAATILGHLCETWRWRRHDETAYATYWRHAIRRLAAEHLLGRLFSATIDVRPPAPEAGEAVRIEIVPTRAGTSFEGWCLDVSSRSLDQADHDPAATEAPGSIERIALPAAGPDGATRVTIADLPAGLSTVSLCPAVSAAVLPDGTMATVSPTLDILFTESPVEPAGGTAATVALEAAALASGGGVVGLDAIASLPEVVGTAAARAEKGMLAARPESLAGTRGWLTSPPVAQLLMLLLAAAAAAAWWQPRGTTAAGRLT